VLAVVRDHRAPPELYRRLEEVALNAWPALQQMLFDGWVVRFARGYTKRANSITPLFAAQLDSAAKIATCERLYAARGLPPVFRLTPFSCPAELDQMLAQRGYRRIDHTAVMHRDLQAGTSLTPSTAVLRHESVSDWIRLWCALHGAAVEQHHTHQAMLDLIPATRLLVSLVQADQVVACGLGVLEHDFFGLFDLVTAPLQRQRGYGGALVSGMLAWARQHGATHAYLQVLHDNAPAHRLYVRLGFQEIYPYWYRVPGV
jgi:ribosomal protein S18 acetylase RimI-like enzyme